MSEASIASSASCSSPMFYSFLYRLCVSPAVCSSFPWPSSFLIVSLLLYSVLCIVILRYIAVKKSNNKRVKYSCLMCKYKSDDHANYMVYGNFQLLPYQEVCKRICKYKPGGLLPYEITQTSNTLHQRL